MIDVESTIYSQYAESASIVQLVKGINEYLDPRADFETFFDLVWNVETAESYGLDVWGGIVDISRFIEIPTRFQPPSAEGSTDVYRLPDEEYRSFILFKAATNITNCSVFSINRLLTNKFQSRGRAYVEDVGGMVMRYVFEFELTFWEKALMLERKVYPKTTGVFVDFLEIPSRLVFGFRGSGLQPFNQAPFLSREPGNFPTFPQYTPFGFRGSNLNPFGQTPFTNRRF